MANVDNPMGFIPIFRLDGQPMVSRIYNKAVGDTAALGVGDLVITTSALNTITRGAAGGPFLGVNMNYAAASTASEHAITICDFDTILVAQEDGDGGAIGTAGEGLNAAIIVAVPDSTAGVSRMEIDSSTAAVDNTLELTLYQVAPYADNDGTLTNARWFVKLNDAQLADLKAGV